MMIRTLFITCLIACLNSGQATAQSEVSTWSSIKLSGKIGSKTTYGLRPIVRHKNSYSDYSNTSMDLSIKRKLGNGFSFFFLERYSWLKDGVNRNLMLMDIRHSLYLFKGVKLSNTIRWHLAHDVEIEDPNFLCYLGTIKFFSENKISSFIGIQYFYRLDGVNEISRTRYRMGINYKLNSKWKINVQLWNTKRVSETGITSSYILLPSLTYKI